MVALGLAAAAGTTVAGGERKAEACALAVMPGQTAPKVRGEEALVAFDPARKVEHFVRSADFQGARAKFGFLVPTPGRPELAEADDAVFARLAKQYLRPEPQRDVLRARLNGSGRGLLAASAAPPPVQVVATQTVAGLDATVLVASDARALSSWLGERGFVDRPALAEWLRPYTTGSWHVTAFQYDPQARGALTSRAVRLTFPTERAYYPYSEPSDVSSEPGRRLRISVIAPWRARASVGRRRWSARVGYAGRPQDLATILAPGLGHPANRQVGPWMTTFEELNSQRGRDDLWFDDARTRAEVAPSIRGVILGSSSGGRGLDPWGH
jgi:hypothetical protein